MGDAVAQDPFPAIRAAQRRLEDAGVFVAADDRGDPDVVEAVSSALEARPLSETSEAQDVERAQVAELVALGALIRTSRHERPMSDDLVDGIREIIRRILNNLGTP